LGVVLAGLFVFAQVKISSEGRYQRTDWKGVATALGRPQFGPRAIVVYQGGLATDPLVFYLRGVPFKSPPGPVTVNEIDVVGNRYQQLADPLAPGSRLISSREVGSFVVDRFALNPTWQLRPDQFASEAGRLLGPPSPDAAVLVQP
jgi:hypothetical protein